MTLERDGGEGVGGGREKAQKSLYYSHFDNVIGSAVKHSLNRNMINLAAGQDHLTEAQAITFGEKMRLFPFHFMVK